MKRTGKKRKSDCKHSSASRRRWLGALLFLLVLCPPGFAQEKGKPTKPQPPPTRMMLPADTSRVDTLRRKSDKLPVGEKVDERLQLPEVLILGKDTQKRVSGKKITISPDQPELVTSPSFYEPIQSGDIRRGSRQSLQRQDSSRSKQGEMSAFGGQFGQFGGSAKWWQGLAAMDYGVEGGVARREGQYANSARHETVARVRLGFYPDEVFRWTINGDYTSSEYGLYGAVIPGAKRKLSGGVLSVASQILFSPTVKFDLQARAATNSLDDKDSLKTVVTSFADNTSYAVTANLKKTLANGELTLELQGRRDEMRTSRFGKQKVRYYSGALAYNFALGQKLSLRVFGTFSAVDTAGKHGQRWRPGAQLIYAPSGRLVAQAAIRSGLSYPSWYERQAANRFIQTQFSPLPEEDKWTFASRLEWRISRPLVFKSGYNRRKVVGYGFFERDSAGTFALLHDNVTLGEFILGWRLELSDKLTAEGGVHFLDDNAHTAILRDSVVTIISSDIPYRGEVRAPVQIEYTPSPRWLIRVEAEWVGPRKTNLHDTRELPAFTQASAFVSFRVHKAVEIFGQVENMLNEKYSRWEGYREMGAHGLAGVRTRW